MDKFAKSERIREGRSTSLRYNRKRKNRIKYISQCKVEELRQVEETKRSEMDALKGFKSQFAC